MRRSQCLSRTAAETDCTFQIRPLTLDSVTTAQECADLAHVRWIGGGTGSGKTTVAQRLAERYDVLVYDGDAAERRYVGQASADKQPQLSGLPRMTVRQRWLQRTPQQIFNEMASMNGETFPLMLNDLRTWPATRPVLVDDFRFINQLADQIAHLFRLEPATETENHQG